MTFSRSEATLIPWGRVVNGFIITLIFLNAITFAADTVPEFAERYGWEFKAFNVFSVIVFTIEYVLRVWSAVEIPMLSRSPHGQARLRFAMRPMMIIDLLAFALALPDRSPAPQGIQAVSPAHARGLLASAADARPRRCR